MSNPKVILDEEVYAKIMYWVNKSNFEVSGLGTVVFDREANAFRVKSAMLLPQENTSTHTEIKPEAICKAMYELRESPGELKFWWHSHVDMAVFWSGTDDATIKEIGANGWVLATVFNKKKETRSAYYSNDHLFPIMLDQLSTEVDRGIDQREATWAEDYEKNVKNQSFTVATYKPLDTWGNMRGAGSMIGKTTDYSEEALRVYVANGQRPMGMTKREWKAIKRQYREDAANPYPFSQEEMTFLAESGIDVTEIDHFMSAGYTRAEILDLVDPQKLADEEVKWEFADDVPVADRRFQ